MKSCISSLKNGDVIFYKHFHHPNEMFSMKFLSFSYTDDFVYTDLGKLSLSSSAIKLVRILKHKPNG